MDKSIPELAAEFHCLCKQMEELHGSQIISLISNTETAIKNAIRSNFSLLHSYSYELNKIKKDSDSNG